MTCDRGPAPTTLDRRERNDLTFTGPTLLEPIETVFCLINIYWVHYDLQRSKGFNKKKGMEKIVS